MFKSATIKLTAWYLALIMGLSIAFSLVLYNSSSASLNTGFEHQRAAIRQQFMEAFGVSLSPYDMDRLREREMTSAEQRLIANLTLANIGVLVAGGAASFYMARRTLQPIEQAMEAQVRFTADASHELRTPLTAMQAEIEVALRDKNLSAAEAREMLQSNLEEVNKLQDLSNGLLALASQDKEHFAPEPVSCQGVASEAISRTAKVAAQKQISIENKVHDISLMGDFDGLTQLIAILLDNAIKYSPAGSTIKMTSYVKGNSGYLAIKDHGYGIKADDLPYIFDRLYRADSSRSKGHIDGYGLGLSIAKKIADLHHGAIEATSKVGKGSTFTVRVPIAPKTT